MWVVLSAVTGAIARRVGERRALVIALALGAAGCVISAASTDIVTMTIGRCLQGSAVAASAIGLSIARRTLDERFVGQATAAISAVFGLGGVIGLTIAGPVVDLVGFRGLFAMSAGLLIIASLSSWLALDAIPARRDARVDAASVLLIGASLTALLIGLDLLGRRSGSGLVSGALLVGAVVFLIVWAVRERRLEQPLINLQQLALRPVWAAAAASLLLGMAMFAAFVIIPVVITDRGFGLGGSATAIGLLLLPSALATFATSFAVPALARRLGDGWVLLAGCVLVAASYGMLALWYTTEAAIITSGIVQGIGVALAVTSILHVALRAVGADDVAATTGVINIARLVGGAIGGQLAAVALAVTSAGGAPTASGFSMTAAFAAGLVLVAAVLSLLCVKRAPSSPRAPA